MALHTPKDLIIAIQRSEVCKEDDELNIVCSEVVMGDKDMNQVRQDFSDLISRASENVSSVTISSVLPDTTGVHVKGFCPLWILRHVTLPKIWCPSFYLRGKKVNV